MRSRIDSTGNLLAAALLFLLGLPAPTEAAPAKVRVGSLGHSLGFLQLDIAEAKGWLRSPQLEAEILYFKAGNDSATALLSGEIQAAVLGVDHAITGQQRGVPIREVALLNRLPGWILAVDVRYKAEIATIADLRGRPVGVTAPGSATHILLTYLLSKHGLKGSDVTVVKAGVATLPDIMGERGIHAGMALEPFGSSMIAEGRAFALVDFRSEADVRRHLGSTYPLTALLVRQDLIDRDPAAVQALTDAIVWASKWLAQAEPADVEKLLPPSYISEPEVWRRSLAGYRDTFSADGSIDVEGIHAVVEAQAAFDPRFDPKSVDVTALYTERFWSISNVKPVGGDPSREPTQPPAAPTATEGRDIDPLVLGSAVTLVLVASAALLWIWRRRGR